MVLRKLSTNSRSSKESQNGIPSSPIGGVSRNSLNGPFRTATSGTPGPVHLDFPADVLYKTGEENAVKILQTSRYRPTESPVGHSSLADQAAKMLAEATLPLIHAGGGVLRSGASEALIELAEYLQAPVTTSMMGRSSIPEDHPLCLIPACPGTGAIVAQLEADVVLLVGGLGDVGTTAPSMGRPGSTEIHSDRHFE